jgi:uncharacterized membrane protein YgcG
MRKDKISRRDFLKVTLLGLGAGFLAACKQVVKPIANVVATFTATPSKTNTPTPTKINTPTATSTKTQTPTPTKIPCFTLLSPENGAKLPAVGKITFSWEVMQGAVLYQIQFTFPSEQVITFETETTNSTRYIESFLAGGTYNWKVTAFDSNDLVICTTEPFTFEKPAYVPPKNNGGDGNNSDGSGSNASGSSSSSSGAGSSGAFSSGSNG